MPPHFATLGMFIIDEFLYMDQDGNPLANPPKSLEPQERLFVGGGGTYAAIGCRIWLPATKIGMIVDKGRDFSFQTELESYGPDMWCFREQPAGSTRALNSYKGDIRGFEYLTPRIPITPRDINVSRLARPRFLHFICSPSRALSILSEVKEVQGWQPVTVYEPIPDSCVPKELPVLIEVLQDISILSPNAEEALSLLSMTQPPTKVLIEEAAHRFSKLFQGCVIIRSGALGAFVLTKQRGQWIDAFWTTKDADKIIDVTGAGNSFLGGLSAGFAFTDDVHQAAMYGAVSSSFIIQQYGLPVLSSSTDGSEKWNSDSPQRRLTELVARSEGIILI